MVFSIARDTDFVQSTEKNHNRIIWAEMNIKLIKVFGGPIMVKGQLILKYPFGVFKSSKKSTKLFFKISALASKKRLNKKNKGTLHH